MQTLFAKKYLPVIIVGFILVGINISAIIWYMLPAGPNQWRDEVVPGKVLSITDTLLTTTDPRGVTKTFILTPETKYIAGRNEVTSDMVQENTIVLVELEQSTSTIPLAAEIRIMTDKRLEKKSR